MDPSSHPWREGYWCNREAVCYIFVINGENVEMKNLACLDYPGARAIFRSKMTYGDFGPTPKDIMDKTGVETYNIQWEVTDFDKKTPAVLSEEGTRIHMYGWIPGKIDMLEWLNDEKLKKLNEEREPVDAPHLPLYITPKPQQMGSILWFSGPPGAGKSTSAQLMARCHSYVYYEADCFLNNTNPFIDIHVPNPSLAQVNQKPLKGHKAEVMEVLQVGMEALEGIMKGNFEGIEEKFEPLAVEMTEHIKQQRNRLGGNWAIAFAVMTRKQREKVRQILGPETIFIVLKMTQACVRKRLIARHGAESANDIVKRLEQMHSMYEDGGADEPNTHNVVVEEDTSEVEVIAKVMEIVANP